METTQSKIMRILGHTNHIDRLVQCGSSLENAIDESLKEYSDAMEYKFRIKAFNGSWDEWKQNVYSKKDMKEAGVYFY